MELTKQIESPKEKEWYDWVEKTYFEWRGNSHRTATQFAGYLGVSQSTVSAWLNRNKGIPKTQRIIDAVVNKYPDAATLLDSQTDPFYGFLSNDWPNMGFETKQEILRIWREDLEERNDVAGLQVLEKFVAENPA